MNNNKIGLQLKAFRKAANLTQKELAALLGVTEFSVSKVENNKFNITLDLLQKYCDALGVDYTIVFSQKSI